MRQRSVTLALVVIGVAALSSTMRTKSVPRLVWNASESAPIGLYDVEPNRPPAANSLVVVEPPKLLASFLAERGYLPLGVPLIKRVLALPGQSVCRTDLLIRIDGIPVGTALERDRLGRPLPIWQGCRQITSGELFLMNRDVPASLDGRYFGPIPISTVVGRVRPMWIFEEH